MDSPPSKGQNKSLLTQDNSVSDVGARSPSPKINRQPIQTSPLHRDYHRYKYYSALKSRFMKTDVGHSFLEAPIHIIDPALFVRAVGDDQKKQGSLVTIFSVWNSMVGAGLVSIPWAFSNSGIILGLFINVSVFLLCFYTCYLMIKSAGKDEDFSETLFKHYGKKGWVAGMVSSFLMIYGGVVVYFLLMSQTIFPVLLALLQWIFGVRQPFSLDLSFGEFSLAYTCLILYAVVQIVVNKRDLSIFIRVSTYGVICVCLILAFIFGVSVYSFTNTSYHVSAYGNDHAHTAEYSQINLFSLNFPALAGVLGCGYFLHTISLPIIKNNEKQENNTRDVFLGYLMVCISYSIVGVMGYFGFTGSYFLGQEFEQNCLNMFSTTHILAFLVRSLSFVQMFTVYPLLTHIARNQLVAALTGEKDLRGVKLFVVNILFILPPLAFGIFYPQVGSLLGYIGSGCGLFIMYLLPIMVHLKRYRLQLTDPVAYQMLETHKLDQLLDNTELFSPMPTPGPRYGKLNESVSTNRMTSRSATINASVRSFKGLNVPKKEIRKFYVSCVFHTFLLLYGVLVLILQFIKF